MKGQKSNGNKGCNWNMKLIHNWFRVHEIQACEVQIFHIQWNQILVQIPSNQIYDYFNFE